MIYFKHLCNASVSQRLTKLEEHYHLAGLGFFWKLMERIWLCNGTYPLQEVLKWSCKGLRKTEILHILNEEDFGLFRIDDNQLIHLIEQSDLPAPTCGTSAGRPAADPAHTGHCPSTREEKNRKRKGERKKSTDEPCLPLPPIELSKEEQTFQEQMQRCYPRVSQMKQPLTSLQMQRLLDDGFSADLIARTLHDMENHPKLLDKYISTYLTLRKWLRMGRY